MKVLLASLLMITATTSVFGWAPVVSAPEIDGSTAATSVAVLGGGLLLLRARRRK